MLPGKAIMAKVVKDCERMGPGEGSKELWREGEKRNGSTPYAVTGPESWKLL